MTSKRRAWSRFLSSRPDGTPSSTAEWLELRIVLILLLPAGAVWGFVEFADAVLDGETEAIDRALLLALRSPTDPAEPLGPEWLAEMARDITALRPYI